MKRSAIVIALALPGAIIAGMYGSLIAAFSGDADPTKAALLCWMAWGAFGGACIGALPGLIVGLFLRVRWVFPFLGSAIGALYGLVEASGVHLAHSMWIFVGGSPQVRFINIAGYANVGAMVLGFLLGLVSWHLLTNPSNLGTPQHERCD